MTDAEQGRLYKKVGERVREFRQNGEETFSQKELADRVGLSRSSIVNIEKGRQRPPLHTIWKIASELAVELTDLIPRMEEVSLPTSVDPELEQRIANEVGEDDLEAIRQIAEFIQTSRDNS